MFCNGRMTRVTPGILVILPLAAAESPREHLSLDANWKFHLGDDWPDALHLENSGTGSGPASEKFSDSFWRAVNLPHDWAVELPFDWAADGSHGFQDAGREVSDEQHRLVSPHV
jgi:beta-galactosidase